MRRKSSLIPFLIILVACFLYACNASKTVVAGADVYEKKVEQKDFTFIARQAFPTEDARFNPRMMFPQGGANLYQLSGGYDVKITPDSVIAYLPFYGRAYTAPMNPAEGGIKFTSTDFSYAVSRKKKNYEITITPKDVREVQKLYFTVSPGGYAYLQVTSTNRTPISFNGVIDNE